MSQTLRKLALVFAVAGLLVSLLAAYTHYKMLANIGYTSFCDVSATVTCTQVYSSRFGTFAGIPVAVFGAIWFAFATLVAIAANVARPAVRESAPGYLFLGSTAALAGVLYLGYASFFILKLSAFCVTTYVAVIGLSSYRRRDVVPMTRCRVVLLRSEGAHVSPIAMILALLFIGTAESALAFSRESAPRGSRARRVGAQANQQSEFERYYTAQPRCPRLLMEGARCWS